jgi:hypothetical protein
MSGINLGYRLVIVIMIVGEAGSHCIIDNIIREAGIVAVSARSYRGGG